MKIYLDVMIGEKAATWPKGAITELKAAGTSCICSVILLFAILTPAKTNFMTDDRELYIHIGTEKTGTTTVQQFLHKNASTLKPLGFFYPNDERKPYFQWIAHFPVAGSLISYEIEFVVPEKQEVMHEAVPQLIKDVLDTSASKVILSCEHFSSRDIDRSVLEAFRDQLSPLFPSIKIICYLRDQPSFALSSYSTSISVGRKEGFSSYVDEVSPENPFYNHLSMLDLWSSVFGKENLLLREFSSAKLLNGDICEDFCAVIGIPFEQCARVDDQNRSFGAIKLEAIREVNRLFPEFNEDADGWRIAQDVRNNFTHHIQVVNDSRVVLPEKVRRQILRSFRKHNETLNTRYMKGSLSKSWFMSDDEPHSDSQHQIDERPAGLSQNRDRLHAALAGAFVSLANQVQRGQQQLQNIQSQLQDTQRQLQDSQQQLQDTQSQLLGANEELQNIRSSKTWRLRQSLIGWMTRPRELFS